MSELIVSTDLQDYAPGSTALITASGFAPGSTVMFEVSHADGNESGAGHDPWYVVDGGVGDLDGVANGSISTRWYVNPDDSLGSSFVLTAATAGADGAFGTGDDLVGTTTFTDDLITATGVTVTHDESTGLQNYLLVGAPTDANDNDLATALPTQFSTRLTTLLSGTGPTEVLIGAALSGFDAANPTGQNIVSVAPTPGGTITGLAFTDASGAPLNGVDSGKNTVDGVDILLYTDTENNNILVGRAGGPTGAIVFAAYIQETLTGSAITGGMMWVAQYGAFEHTNPLNPDDALDLTDLVYIAASQDTEFSLANAPSGQNLFLMFTKANPTTYVDDNDVTRISDVTIVATGKVPKIGADGKFTNDSDTINTSQAGGPTTFGTNSQMITEQEGICFTFVTGARQDVTIPNLDQTEADVEANIDFTGVFGARTADFDVVQLQSGKSAQLKISAFSTAVESGVNFIDVNGYAVDAAVAITSVRVLSATGAVLETFSNGVEGGVTSAISISISGGVASLTGIKAGHSIEYTTTTDHNRVLIENGAALNASGNTHADFDIGGFRLLQVSTATAEVGSKMIFEDDGPSIVVADTAGPDPLTVDETILATNASASFADNFSSTPSYGADGAGTVSSAYALSLSASGADSGLDDVATGNSVFLFLNAGVVQGREGTDAIDAATGDIVFTVSVNAAGLVTLDQQRAIVHPDPANPDDSKTLSAANLIVLTRTDTITDKDGDQSTGSDFLNIGQALNFEDDGPSIVVADILPPDPLTVDETILATNASADFSNNFSSTPSYGADGAGTVSSAYALSLSASGADSGLDDVATGNSVFLFLNAGVVQGREGTDATDAATGDIVFTVSVNAAGLVTLDQQRAIVHPNTANPDDSKTLAAADLIVLTRTDTITDRDGDQNTGSDFLNIGQALNFEDDGPSIVVADTAGPDPLTVDETILATNASASFADNFSSTPSYGADGAGTVSSAYALSLSASGADSGLDDVATGNSVFLFLNAGVVQGREGTDAIDAATGDIVFTVSVNAAGLVTLDQQRAIVHPDPANPDDSKTLSAANLIVLTRTDTITDKDGDQSTGSDFLNIGQALNFEDDGPSIVVADILPPDPLTVDETILATNASADFSNNFSSTPSYGADGAGTVSSAYALSLSASGADSGLDDVATGNSVFLFLNAGVVQGREGTDATDAATGDIVFTVSVNAAGLVTLDQQRAIVHPNTANPDDSKTLAAADLIVLTRTDTITDRDGDQNTGSDFLNIGQALNFEDDGPSIVVADTAVADPLTVDETLADNASASFADNFSSTPSYGADGAGTVSSAYALSVKSAGVASGLVDTLSNQSVVLTLNAGVVEGRTASSGLLVFTVGVDAAGLVTLDQQRAIVHPDTTNPDDSKTLSAADLIVLTRTDTIIDKDGDQNTGSDFLNIGQALNFEDDGPTIETPPVQDEDPTLGATSWLFSGAFAYAMGEDKRGPTYSSAAASDFTGFTLSGLANEVAIVDPSVTWDSEDANAATFNVSFKYDHDRNDATDPALVEGTLVFDKVNDSYTFEMDALQVQQDVTLGEGTGYETYDVNGTSPSSGPSNVATGKLGEGFYIQITGFESPLIAGGNTVVTAGELVSGTVATVTLSSVALGVSGNTIQSGEAATINFFETDPKGNLGATNFSYATDFFIKFDGFETESDDLVLVVSLADANDSSVTTTRAIYVDQGDVYENDTVNTDLAGTKYEALILNDPTDPADPFLDNNDALLIVESNDYSLGGNWVIKGIQILSNDAGLTGGAINLNRNVGDDGGSSTSAQTVVGLVGPGNTIAEDSSTNPLKIIDAGFSTTTTTAPTLDLTLDFKVVDADGDSTGVQTIDIENPVPIELLGFAPTDFGP